ncbi:MAG: hypothetical protein AABW83_02040 [Nanoarchaeota archaeon]
MVKDKKFLLDEKLIPSLYNKSYIPDPSSHESRWTNRIFRDKKTQAIIIPTSQYLLQNPWWIINGMFDPSTNIIQNDRERSSKEYEKTTNHELYHADGKDEYTTRFLNKDPFMNYN